MKQSKPAAAAAETAASAGHCWEKSERARHQDWDDDAKNQKQVYTVLLYCTPGHDSTTCPLFTLDEFTLRIISRRRPT